MNIGIVLFILLINIVNIFTIYKLLGKDLGSKEKIIFIAVGVAIMYMIVSGVYWLSGIGIDENATEAGRDFITFTFVPVNSLCVFTFFSVSYKSYKNGRIKSDILKNRTILLVAILFILLIIEFFYFKNIQNNALEILKNNTINKIVQENVTQENIEQNSTETNNQVTGNTSEDNIINNSVVDNTVNNLTNSSAINSQENNLVENTSTNNTTNGIVENNVLQ